MKDFSEEEKDFIRDFSALTKKHDVVFGRTRDGDYEIFGQFDEASESWNVYLEMDDLHTGYVLEELL